MQDGLKTMDDQRIKEIRNAAAKASPAPWKWAYDIVEEPTDDPELLNLGIGTSLAGFKHIQLKSGNKHRFWIELTDTGVAGDLVFDFDFIIGARVGAGASRGG